MRKSIGVILFIIVAGLAGCRAQQTPDTTVIPVSAADAAASAAANAADKDSPSITPTPSLVSARLIPVDHETATPELLATNVIATALNLQPTETFTASPVISNTPQPENASPTPPPTDKTKKPTSTPVPTQLSPTNTPLPTNLITPTPTSLQWPIQGITINNLSSTRDVSLISNAGGYWTRFDRFHWDEIEPQLQDPPVYYWDSVAETGLSTASAAGVQVIAIIQFAPRWAQKYPGVSCGPFAQEAFAAFGRFMNAVVSRYSQPPFNVKYWEIGNEPDVSYELVAPNSGFGCWGDPNDAYYGGGYYAEMLKTVYPQIKAADPEAQVLVGGLLLDCDPDNPPEDPAGSGNYKDCTPSRFIEGILHNGGGAYFDGISFHTYDYYYGGMGKYGNMGWHSSWNTTGPVLTAKVIYLRSLLAKYGYPEKSLYNTELAILCGSSGNESTCLTDEFAQTKADYLAEANVAAQAAHLQANLWYSLLGWRASNLVTANRNPLPAYLAYQASVQRLTKSVLSTELTQFSQVKGYAFNREGTVLWVLWSLDGETHLVQLPTEPNAIYNVYGQTQPAIQNLTVTSDPVYIEWNP